MAKTKLFAYQFLQYHALSNYAADLGLSLPGAVSIGSTTVAPQTDTALDPVAILASLDAPLGALGQSDLKASSVISNSEVQSANFTVSTDSGNQPQRLFRTSCLWVIWVLYATPLGTDIINFDPNNFAVASELFTQNSGQIYGFVTDIDTSGYNQTVQMQSGEIFFIQNSATFTDTISNFVAGDTIDLAGIVGVSGASLGADNVLTLLNTGVTTAPYSLTPAMTSPGKVSMSFRTGVAAQILPYSRGPSRQLILW